MYKRVSTALLSTGFRLMLSTLAIAALTVVCVGHWHYVKDSNVQALTALLMALCFILPLTVVNLYSEVRKWMVLIKAPHLPVRQGFVQILSGMCSGFITPNRIGEFVGRMSFLPAGLRKRAPGGALAGALIQGGVTALFGMVGALAFPAAQHWGVGNQLWWVVGAVFLVILTTAFFMRKVSALWFRRVSSGWLYFRSLKPGAIAQALGWGVLRYAVFSTQMVIALYCFGLQLDLTSAYCGVFLMYFMQSFIPGPALGELGVRELLAMFIFGAFMPHPIHAALAGLAVWIANIGLPVLAGVSVMGLSVRHGAR